MNGQIDTRWTWLFLALSGLVSTNFAAAATEPESTRLVIILATVKGAPPLKPQVVKLIEAPLASKAVLIPSATYLKAAKAAGLKPAVAESSSAISLVGKRVGATKVLLLKPIIEPGAEPEPPPAGKKGKGGKGKAKKAKKGPKNFVLEAVLYDVATSQILLSSTYPLANGKKLLPEVGQQLVREVSPKLEPAISSPPVPIPTPAPEPAPTPIAAPPPPIAPQDTELRQAPVQAMGDISPFAPAPPPEPVIETMPTPPSAEIFDRREAWRSALSLRLGWLAWHRDAEITAKAGEKPPLYSTLRDGENRDKYQYGFPSLSRIAGNLELYPFAFGGNGSFHEGIGVYGEGSLGMIRSVTVNTKAEISSLVHDLRAGAVYRLVFWNSPTAIEGQIRLGLNAYGFPLKQTVFPSFSYVGPMLGARVVIPLGIAWLQVLLGADLSRFGGIGLSTTTFLGKVNGVTSADTFHGGLRGVISVAPNFALDLSLLAQYQSYSAPFLGQTQLQDTAQFDNVKYAENNLGALLLAGIAL